MAPDKEPQIVIATLLTAEGPTGVQSHFNELRHHLLEIGRPTELVTPFDAPRAVVYPTFALRRIIDLISPSASVWWYRHWHEVFLRWALRRRLAESPRSVVYAQCPLSARAALESRQGTSQPVVMVVHFNGSQADEWCEKGKLKTDGAIANSIRSVEHRVLPSLDGIVYVSRYMKDKLEMRIPSLRNVDSTVIPNFCRPAPARGRMSQVDVINVGTLEPRKNQSFLIRALAHASGRGHRYTLALVGDGPDRIKLERLAHDLGIEQQVRFLGNQPRAIDLMTSARMYAHSATVENLPMALIEAMACGLPILAPAVGGIPDLFEDGEGGIFWNTDDHIAGGELLVRILGNSDALISMGHAAKARFDDQFETSRVATRLEAFISEGARSDKRTNTFEPSAE